MFFFAIPILERVPTLSFYIIEFLEFKVKPWVVMGKIPLIACQNTVVDAATKGSSKATLHVTR